MENWFDALSDGISREHFQHERPGRQEDDSRLMRGLVDAGLAGQDAGPPGFGPAPALVHQPGGDLLSALQSPTFLTVEHLFRVLPETSWFDPVVSPTRPVKFELGALRVPEGQAFIITDYEFVALRQSGLDPFDFMQAEPYRFSGYMGFDCTVEGRRSSNLLFQLDPQPVQFDRVEFGSGRASAAKFARAQANSFASVAGEGTSLLPVRPNVQGPRGKPFTMYATSQDRVSLMCTIFRRVQAPLAGLQGSVSGFSLHMSALGALLERMRPR